MNFWTPYPPLLIWSSSYEDRNVLPLGSSKVKWERGKPREYNCMIYCSDTSQEKGYSASLSSHAQPNTQIYDHDFWQQNIKIVLSTCLNIWAATWDFQQYGILTWIDSGEPLPPPFELRNSKCCSVSSLQSKNIQATSKSSDLTAHMRRLVWAFACRTYHIVGNLLSRLNYVVGPQTIFGCSTEPSHWDGSFEYPQNMF